MENKPSDPINMVEGCHMAWYGQVIQFITAYKTSLNIDHLWNRDGMDRIDYARDLTFSYVTILEFVYP